MMMHTSRQPSKPDHPRFQSELFLATATMDFFLVPPERQAELTGHLVGRCHRDFLVRFMPPTPQCLFQFSIVFLKFGGVGFQTCRVVRSHDLYHDGRAVVVGSARNPYCRFQSRLRSH